MRYAAYALGLLALLCCISAVAQAPPIDAVVVADNHYDSQVGNTYALKVESTENKARVLVLKNAIWGMDDQNRVRFQLFTDGTLHLFNANYQETVILDGANGQIIVNGRIWKNCSE